LAAIGIALSMSTSPGQFSTNRIDTPVLRAGFFALCGVVASVLLIAGATWIIASDDEASLSGKSTLTAFVVFMGLVLHHRFSRELVRLTIAKDFVTIVLPWRHFRVATDQIESVRIRPTWVYAVLHVSVACRNARRKIRMTIFGPMTPWGTLSACHERLEHELTRMNIPIRRAQSLLPGTFTPRLRARVVGIIAVVLLASGVAGLTLVRLGYMRSDVLSRVPLESVAMLLAVVGLILLWSYLLRVVGRASSSRK
jgi:hypothetical protein